MRPRHRTPGRHLTALLALVAGACTAGAQDEVETPGNRAVADTLRGAVSVVGADPLTRVVLRTGDDQIRLEGPGAETLRRVNGLIVQVEGRLQDSTMTVAGFHVRAADGLPAADGILEIEGDTAVLVTPAGERLRYAPAPSALRGQAGKRVWIAGETGSEPRAWGVIGG